MVSAGNIRCGEIRPIPPIMELFHLEEGRYILQPESLGLLLTHLQNKERRDVILYIPGISSGFFLKKQKNKILTCYADNWEMGRGTYIYQVPAVCQ